MGYFLHCFSSIYTALGNARLADSEIMQSQNFTVLGHRVTSYKCNCALQMCTSYRNCAMELPEYNQAVLPL